MNPSAPAITISWSHIAKAAFRFAVCIAAIIVVIAVLALTHVQHDRLLSAALNLFLIAVFVVSVRWGTWYAMFLSVFSALAFSWLLPPAGHLHLTDGRVWTLFTACVVSGLVGSQLSRRLRRAVFDANQRHAEAVAEQQRFRDLVDSVDGIVWEGDAETFVFSFVSEQAERILGYPIAAWLKEPTFWKDHLHPEDRESAVQFCLNAIAQKRSHDFEYRMIGADGRVVWIRDLVTLVVENGRATRLRGVMVDITRRKRNEEALREQANLLDLTHDAVAVRDMKRVIKYWNRGAEALYGWTAEEAVGRVIYDLLKTELPAPLEQIEAEVIRTGRWEGELAHTRKDGTHVVVASRWSLQTDEYGAPVAILVTNNDISERKRAEEARKEIEEQWRAAFESNPTMYFIVDSAGNIVSVNTFGAEQLGYSTGELIGQPVLSVFYEPDRTAVQDRARSCFLRPDQMLRWEARKIRKDGAMIWVRETAKTVSLKKRPVLLVVCEDITEQKRAEDAVLRSEKELRDLIETIPVMVFSIRPDGSTEYVSRSGQTYTGLSLEETTGGWQGIIHPDDVDTHLNKWRASLATGQPFENEARHRNAKGEYCWFLVRAVALRDEHGTILKWYGTLTDIQDRKRAEALLGAEKRLLEMIATGVALEEILNELCLVIEELRSGTLASVLLLNPDGVHLDFVAGPSLPNEWTQQMERLPIGPCAGSCGTAAYRGSQVIVCDIATDPLWEVPEHRASALKHKLRASWSNPVLSSKGRVLGTFCMYYREPRTPSTQDLDLVEFATHIVQVAIERKRAEEELRKAETRFRTYVDHATDALFVFDDQEKIIDANREACESLGYTREELIGMRPHDIDASANAASLQWIRERLGAGEICTFETYHRRKDRTEFPVEVRIRLLWQGDQRMALALARDTNDRKRAEQERERLRQLQAELARINRMTTMGELTASVAHEVNQPIAAAVTNANTSVRWLANEVPNIDEAREAAKRAAKDATRAAEIINRIRSLFKKGDAQREWVDVNDVINDMIVLLRSEAIRYNVSIHRELSADLPNVMADRVQLQQVLMNLMANSIDAMKGIDGRRELVLTAERDGSDQLLVSVCDTGVGLPPDANQIFSAFFTTKPHGTGMGLAISRTIIESHGGHLWASANSGRGATFSFTLPIQSEVQV